jgi:tRNA(fMet)-specific endonuclease VapC
MILDTNGLSSLLVLDPAFLKQFSTVQKWFIPVPVFGEYRYGIYRSKQRVILEKIIDELEKTQVVLPLFPSTARYYARIRDDLRKKGRPIPVNDLWIAALGMENRMPVVTRDQHFQGIEGLEVVSW